MENLTTHDGTCCGSTRVVIATWQMVDAINELAAIKTEILTRLITQGLLPIE